MVAEVRRLVFAEGVTVTSPISYSIPIARSGVVDLVSGEISKTIVFSSAMASATFSPIVSILCDDANQIFLSHVVKNRTVNGFDVFLNAPVDSNNYKISYLVGEQL